MIQMRFPFGESSIVSPLILSCIFRWNPFSMVMFFPYAEGLEPGQICGSALADDAPSNESNGGEEGLRI